MLFKQKMFLDEDERGNKLLTPLAGIFVSKSNKDITIELSKLEPGWKIKGSNVKVRTGNLVVNSLPPLIVMIKIHAACLSATGLAMDKLVGLSESLERENSSPILKTIPLLRVSLLLLLLFVFGKRMLPFPRRGSRVVWMSTYKKAKNPVFQVTCSCLVRYRSTLNQSDNLISEENPYLSTV